MSIIKRIAYKIVLKDLKKIDFFRGEYDAKNGDDLFMYGIASVMEQIAYSISENTGVDFEEEFIENLIKSEDKD